MDIMRNFGAEYMQDLENGEKLYRIELLNNCVKHMQEYEIEIDEILQKIVKVVAESKEDAIRLVSKKYRNEEIILTAEDFKDVNFK